MSTNEDQVRGNVVNVKVDGTTLGLVERGSVDFSAGEDDETIELATKTTTQTFPSIRDPELSVSSFLAVDADALEELGIVDADGNYVRDTDREHDELEIEYLDAEDGAVELAHRFEDVRVNLDDLDIGANPPSFDFTVKIDGDIVLNYEEA